MPLLAEPGKLSSLYTCLSETGIQADKPRSGGVRFGGGLYMAPSSSK